MTSFAFTTGLSGGAAAIAPALLKVFLDFAIGVVSAFAFTAISMAITGDFSLETLEGAVADAIFWGGVFAFVSASVNAVKTVARTYAQGGKACDVVGQCFIAGTLVLCMDEKGNQCHKPIEEVKVGDMVWAYDEGTGESDWKPVVRLFRNEMKCWCTVFIKPENGQEAFEIISTPGHKYYLPDNIYNRDMGMQLEHAGYTELSEKWVSAENLKFGDKVLLSDGTYGIIQSVEINQLAKSETTYNFEVKDFHTYYVGEQSVCVHNANCGFGKYKNGMEMTPNEALDAATDFLGEGYKEVSPNRFVSADGVRQVRMSPLDLATVNNHAGGPHLNFDILKPKYKTIHIYIKGL